MTGSGVGRTEEALVVFVPARFSRLYIATVLRRLRPPLTKSRSKSARKITPAITTGSGFNWTQVLYQWKRLDQSLLPAETGVGLALDVVC